jgi:hypothetical protein
MLPFDGEAAFLSETVVKSSLLAKPANASTARGEFFATVGKKNYIQLTDTLVQDILCAMVILCSSET